MLFPIAAALIVTLAAQPAAADRTRAVELARSGRTSEALTIFERIADASPDDMEARLWIARLHARLGRTAVAEREFRDVLQTHPSDVDARIGLSAVLLRRDAWREALATLQEVEPAAGDNADFFAVLARAYLRAGDDRQALDYLRRAKAIAPGDEEIAQAYIDAAEVYVNSILFEGFGEHTGVSGNAGSGTLAAGLRAAPRVRLVLSARVQQRGGSTDTEAGGGVEWRFARSDNLDVRALGGHGNVSLPNGDFLADLVHFTGPFEIGGGVRYLSYEDANVLAAWPVLAWDRGGRWRTDTRYTYSHLTSRHTGQTSGDSSVLVRQIWRATWRVRLTAAYAYGIESFEDLASDRLGAFGATTAAFGARIRMSGLSQLFVTWEHQWRSNDTALDRLTLAVTRAFP
jgi:thioredoxin-like negative regulator of GroEL